MTSEVFESWAIVELMGHRKRPGYAKEVELAGGKMLRVDIPVSDGESVTEFYGTSALYAIRPATEEVVRDMAYRGYGVDPRPIRPVDYRPQSQIASDVDDDDLP
ncbi:hypothetical protein FHX08_002046 [Rhizobium sp. BK529]|uniref:acetyltransferase n=1 Tax=Rhizobium sp. BK529 TaxID=2586983 RepID=UPI001607181C|nr:acetyltransferase [Rhizobium sp. BK529]MBB3591702.1 hypothetical protein [Rhizobium sp. BK529]